MKTFRTTFFAVAVSFSAAHSCLAFESREERELAMAEDAIFWSRVASASSFVREACSRNSFACSDDRAELGLALLAAKSSSAAIDALTGLLRYRIDGGLSEDFTCYILKKKKAAQKSLVRLKPESLYEKCVSEVALRAAQQPNVLRGVGASEICTSTADLDAKRRALIAQLTNGKQCLSSDF